MAAPHVDGEGGTIEDERRHDERECRNHERRPHQRVAHVIFGILSPTLPTHTLHEALDLFAQIVNSKHFVDADVIIFLNKKDLFYEKIQHVDPGTWFPEYKGGCDAEAAEAFFKEQFRKRVDDQSKLVYMYTTCATDTGNMKTIFNAVTDMFASQMVAGGVAWGVG